MNSFNKAKVALVMVFLLTACSTAIHMAGRGPSGVGRSPSDYGAGGPPGLLNSDESDFNHISEGSEVYPYEWMRVLRSATFKDESGNTTLPFLSQLSARFGFLESRNQGRYLMSYEGLTAAWSDADPRSSDAFVEDKNVKVKELNGVKSIKMVGTNCALCHSGEVRYGGKNYRIDGAPNIANIRGYFQDLAQSTVATLAKTALLTQFLSDLGVANPEENAKKLSHDFLVDLGEETGLGWGVVSGYYTLGKAGLLDDRGRLFKGKKAIATALEKLLRLTYGFSDQDNIGVLRARMQFLGNLFVGTNPKTEETPSGFGRTDAFGRIGNLILRDENPIGYTAPVSLPWIWGIKYEAMLHYTGNTNSVTLRNIGESLGLGSIILGADGSSTTNLFNLDRLERLAHKIKVPMWEEIFADQPALKVNHSLADAGREVYQQKCMKCHETTRRVGPQNALYDYNIYSLEDIGTDATAAENVIVPVKGKEFRNAIFGGVEHVKSAFYQRYKVPAEEQAAIEFSDLRGKEFFRDTAKGFSGQATLGNNYGDIPGQKYGDPKMGYKARHLSGVWATAPFLHNGSVPTIVDLLKPAKERPKVFSVESKEFDPIHIGYSYKRKSTYFGNQKKCGKKEDTCFDTSLKGNSNLGHEGPEFGTDLDEGRKAALIEYLKILPPEPEYAW